MRLLLYQGYLAGMAQQKSKMDLSPTGRATSQLAAIILVFLLVSMSYQSVFAQTSATCRSLQSQLATIETGRGSGNSAQYQKYDRALKAQQSQIRKTERAATLNGCKLFRSNLCNRINGSLEQMYANMESLRVTRDSLASSGGTRSDRNKILRSLDANGCNASQASTSNEPKDKRRTLLEQIFGNKVYTDEGTERVTNSDLNNQFGTFRTLCVRTCDGYYFPISFSTTKARFEADQEQCQQMCPGSETALFYHPMPDGDAETAISYRTGEPYTALPTAFSYRKNVNSECSCRFATKPEGFQEIAGTTASEKPEITQELPRQVTPTPTFRQDRGLDIETAENLEGGLTIDKLASLANNTDDKVAGAKDIRIVGPAFFPVQ